MTTRALILAGAGIGLLGIAIGGAAAFRLRPQGPTVTHITTPDSVRHGQPTEHVGPLGGLTTRTVKPDTVWLSRPGTDPSANAFCRDMARRDTPPLTPPASAPAAPAATPGIPAEASSTAPAPAGAPIAAAADTQPPLLLLQGGRAQGRRLELWGVTSAEQAYRAAFPLAHSFPRLEWGLSEDGRHTFVHEARALRLFGLFTPHIGATIGASGLWDPTDGRIHIGPGASAGVALTWP